MTGGTRPGTATLFWNRDLRHPNRRLLRFTAPIARRAICTQDDRLPELRSANCSARVCVRLIPNWSADRPPGSGRGRSAEVATPALPGLAVCNAAGSDEKPHGPPAADAVK